MVPLELSLGKPKIYAEDEFSVLVTSLGTWGILSGIELHFEVH